MATNRLVNGQADGMTDHERAMILAVRDALHAHEARVSKVVADMFKGLAPLVDTLAKLATAMASSRTPGLLIIRHSDGTESTVTPMAPPPVAAKSLDSEALPEIDLPSADMIRVDGDLPWLPSADSIRPNGGPET